MVSTSLVLARFVQIRRRGLVFMITMIVGIGDQILQAFAPSYAAFAVLRAPRSRSGRRPIYAPSPKDPSG